MAEMSNLSSTEIEQLQRDAFAAFDSGDYDRAELLYRSLIDQTSGKTQRNAWFMLGFVKAQRGAYDAARRIYTELLDTATTDRARHRTLHQLGMVERMAEDYEAALEYFDEELMHIPDEDNMALATHLYEQGYVRFLQGKPKDALSYLLNARDTTDAAGVSAVIFKGLGEVEAYLGNTRNARDYYKQSIELFQTLGNTRGADDVRQLMAKL